MVSVVTYEQRLNADRRWALREGSLHFEKESAVHTSLQRIAKRLDELGVPYALVDGMAMFMHGYRRFTEDVDILVTRDGLKTIHERLEGLGDLPPFAGSKNLRDTQNGVRIEFLISGGYPGDGLPKPVSFPDQAMGLSFFIRGGGAQRLIGHTGIQAGFRSFFYFNPVTSAAVISVFNTTNEAAPADAVYNRLHAAAQALIR